MRAPSATSIAPPAASTFGELIARARRADAEALTTLYRLHADALMAVAARIVGSTPDAEDVVQDLFVGLPEALGQYTEQGQLDAWLRRVVVRLSLARVRARNRRREDALDPRTEPPAATPERLVVPADGVIDRVALERAIAALPEPLRLVFLLREVEGYAHAEVAALLGISRGASEVRLFRAIRRLRALLA